MNYLLIRDRFGKADRLEQESILRRLLKSKGIKKSTKIDQSMATGATYKELNGSLKNCMRPNDRLIISQLSILGTSFSSIIDILDLYLKSQFIIYSASEKLEIRGDGINHRLLSKVFKISKDVEHSILKDRAARSLSTRKASGNVGRPKGTKSGKTKLSGHEDEIRKLLNSKVSISAIARIHKVNRLTMQKFVKRLKEASH